MSSNIEKMIKVRAKFLTLLDSSLFEENTPRRTSLEKSTLEKLENIPTEV